MGELEETDYRAIVHQAKSETFRQLEQWIGYGLKNHTVFFLGIHGRQWWALRSEPRERPAAGR
ncbi:hypothetical protein [Streptomyces xanthophaeus]